MSEDEELWARAQADLDATAPEPASRQAARERYDRRLTRVSVVLAGAAVALGLLAPLLDPGDDRATWRVVAALTIAVLGLLLMIVGPLARPFGSGREVAGPLEWLTAQQRMKLMRQVRGGNGAPTRLPLAQLQARAMIRRRADVLPQVGLLTSFVGLWVLDHSWWRAILTSLFAAVVAVLAVRRHREERLARRFLAEHPAHDGS